MAPLEKLIVTADDFGISPGVNQAVIKAHLHGGLTNASLMVNAAHFEEAVNLAKTQAPNLKLGLHINLTGGKPVLPAKQVPHLVNSTGHFRYGPVGLLLQTILNPHILNEISKEISAQINRLQECSINISHVDGHHHVQMIPAIFKIVTKLAEKYKVPRIRVVNESLGNTILTTRNLTCLYNGGLLRYALLKLLCVVSGAKTDTYFFSILNSCRITPDLVKNIRAPKGFRNIEIMLHPGNAELDKHAATGDINEQLHLTSSCRDVEFGVAMLLKQ